MLRIGIATPVIIEGDAVSTDVRGMAFVLNRLGHHAEMFAEGAVTPEPVRPIAELGELDVFIYHHSVYCEQGVRYFTEARCRKIVKYHNITPPHFFDADSQLRENCERGLAQLAEILSVPCEVWADSTYNGCQLAAIRPRDFRVLPPFHQVDTLLATEADPNFSRTLSDSRATLLVVGRVAPNKDVLAAVDVYAAYRRLDPTARLVIAGDHSGPYGGAVINRVREHNLNGGVYLTGWVSREQLKALYQLASALLVTSRHEGFCVPMVEAMAFGVPVVSRTDAALAETGAGVVRFCDGGPDDWALAIRDALANREMHVRAGHAKYNNQFHNSRIADTLRNWIAQNPAI